MSSSTTKKAVHGVARLCPLIEANAQDVGRQLGEYVQPMLCPGETAPDFTLVLDLPARLLRDNARRLHESQAKLDEAEKKNVEARSERDRAAVALRQEVVGIRRLLAAVYGPQHGATVLGIDGATAHTSQTEALLSQAESVLEGLRDPKRVTRTSSQLGAFDADLAAETIESPAARLRDAHRRLAELRHGISALRELRNDAFLQLDHSIDCSMSILRGFFSLVHRPDLAHRLAPADRKRNKSGKSRKKK